jgi:glucose-6-phosphate isomerase
MYNVAVSGMTGSGTVIATLLWVVSTTGATPETVAQVRAAWTI